MPTKNRFSILLALVTMAAIALGPMSSSAGSDKKYADGELLVRFKTGYEGKGAAFINKMGAKVNEKLSKLRISRLNLPKNMAVEKAVAKLRALPFVEVAEPNYIFKPTWKTNDPRWDEQWGITKANVPGAWGSETGDPSMIIAILDTGVDLDHPDLKDKLVAGYDYVDNDSTPDDVGGHGTHCAGIAAASTNNGKGVAGVCPNCSIMPVRVLGANGGFASDVAKGIIWAVDHGAKVISMSLGGAASSTTQNDAVDYAWKNGAVVVAAAGNSNTQSAHYPAYHSTCIAVASSEGGDDRSQFSNYGSWVDVAAPGSYIMSTTVGGSYGNKSGTSMATPFVAGLAGLVFSKAGKGTSPSKIRSAIEDTCAGVGSWVIHGRVDAKRAVAAVSSSAPTPTPTTPDPEPEPAEPVKTPTPTTGSDDGYAPKAYSVSKGSAIKSPSNSLVKSDNSLLVLSSTKSKKRRYLDVTVEGTVVKKGTPGLLQVLVEGRYYVTSGTLTAYMWNWTTSAWDKVSTESFPTDKDKTVIFRKYAGAAYVSGSGKVKVRLTAESNWFQTFEVGLDKVRFYLSSSSGGGSGSSGGSSGSTGGTKTKEPSTSGGGDDGSDDGAVDLKKKASEALKGLLGS